MIFNPDPYSDSTPQEQSNYLYLQFLFAGEPAKFLVDTNLSLHHLSGNIFIALAYPKLIVEVGGDKIEINCQQPDFHAKPDEYPLFQFLKLYPEFAEKIVHAHQAITALYGEFLDKFWNELTSSKSSQDFLDKHTKRIRCIYCLPKEKDGK